MRRILIVDDEPTLRFGFAYALTGEDMESDTASNGAEALNFLAQNSYDAVVMDLRMPDLDGLAVIRKMRAGGDRTPVILCSAFITLETVLSAISEQVADFLMKPVKPQQLRDAVGMVFGDDNSCIGHALAAVRRGDYREAIGILEADRNTPDEDAWLRVLVALRDNRFDVQMAEAELDVPLVGMLVVHEGN